MRRALPIFVISLVLVAASARPVFAQQFRIGGYATLFSSSHMDEFFASYSRPLGRQLTPDPKIAGETRNLDWSWLGEIRLGVDWGRGTNSSNGFVLEALGGLRATNDTLLRWPIFAELKVGVAHFPGSNHAIIHPSVGLDFPGGGRRWNWFASVGTPIAFFGGNTEVGIEGGIGFTFPINR